MEGDFSNSLRSISKRGSSFRASLEAHSSNFWRDTGSQAFSKSSLREVDDEEALKWAALEKLPTFDRLKKGVIVGSKGANEIDVHNLGFVDKKNLLDRLVNTVEDDNEKFLLKLRNRMDRVGIDLPTIEVKFEHLNIDAEAYSASRALPTFINFFINFMEGILNALHIIPSRKKPFTILKNVSGIIKPCRMTLLLGPPSSGKTTLLLALAGKLDPSLKTSGRITYNGHELTEFIPRRTAAYISQYDLHIGEMTVRETLAFSARCQGVGSQYDMLAELCRREKTANIKPHPDVDVYMKAAATEGDKANVVTDYVLKILGLEECADTMVGDEMLRGISGGQKKRVTTGEMLVGPAKAFFMDEISTGLDSSTTFQIIKMLRQQVHIMKGTAFITLLQPAPETYDLFDDIVLLSDSQIVYQGPRENVIGFFESMGFKCPERKAVADFLQEVTSKKDQGQYWTSIDEPYQFISAGEFAEAFQSYFVGRKLGDEVATPYDKSKSHPSALTTKKYGIGEIGLLKACIDREVLLIKRNSFAYFFKLFQVTCMAIFAMIIFFRTEMHKNNLADGGVFIGALFFTVMVIMFNGFSELAMTIQKLPVFYKQRDMFFFPAWAYGIPSWILKLPITFVEVGIWTFITYYAVGFDPNVKRLFMQYLLLIVMQQASSGLFRVIGATGRNMIIANTFGVFAILMLFSLGGFVLSKDDIKPWFIWGYWSSIMMYAQNALLVNEFTGNSWSKMVNGTKLGTLVLESRGFFPQAHWYLIGVGALVGFIFVFNFIFILALTFLDPIEKPQAVLPEKGEDHTLKCGEVTIENRRRGMILPFEPHYITFDDVRYSVDMPSEMKAQGAIQEKLELLKGVSGAFRPGVLTALMGVTGAGKTTLMDVLAGRKTGGYIEGSITISGFPKNQATFARISGYCEQTDIHSPNVTVYESLVYSAWLRLPREVDAETRKLFIQEVMELVELTPLRGALVGLPGVNGLSIEQRKRLTIAVELVANPSIIFMDEPTSGLDARAAAIVMRTVRNTVNTGRTVVCTIHQPSIDIFEAFDELFLMTRGGQEIYVGPLGRQSAHLISYFEAVKGVAKIKDGYNPATWMLEVTTSLQEHILEIDFANHYKNSELLKRNKALIKQLRTPRAGTNDLYFSTKYSQDFYTQCLACLWKQHWSYWRNPPYTAVRFLFTNFIALIFGAMFWNLGSRWHTQQDLFNAMGSMYTAINFLGFQYGTTLQPVVAVERTVFYRERAAGMYSAFPYAFAQFLIEVPYVFVQTIMYGIIVYSMMGFPWSAERFFWFIYFLYFSFMYYVAYGMMTVAIAPNLNIASLMSTFLYFLWNIFSGFLIPRPRMPIWCRWNYWATPMAYTLYGFMISQYGQIEEQMDSGETVVEFLKEYFGFRYDMLGPVAVMLVGFVVLFTFIYGFSIMRLNFQRR